LKNRHQPFQGIPIPNRIKYLSVKSDAKTDILLQVNSSFTDQGATAGSWCSSELLSLGPSVVDLGKPPADRCDAFELLVNKSSSLHYVVSGRMFEYLLDMHIHLSEYRGGDGIAVALVGENGHTLLDAERLENGF
jgi:hypothetical protein